ncbi:hypothetical protein ACFVH6_22100 [Spirillospora sp. NPDC127200]
MICTPCAEAADTEPALGHLPEICHDHGRDIRACPCQHKPARTPEQQ